MLQTITMMYLYGDRPPTKIIGIIPEVVDITTLKLTKAVLEGSKVMEDTFIKHLKSLGFEVEIKEPSVTIQEVADNSCQSEYDDSSF